MKALFEHALFDFRDGIRNRHLLFLNYLFPLGLYLMLGSIMPGINPYFRDLMIPGMTIVAILAATLLGLPESLVNSRESGQFRSYWINGVPAAAVLLVPVFTTLLHLAIVTLLIAISAPLLFAAPTPADWPAFIGICLVGALTLAAIGLLIGVVSPNSRVALLWSQLLFVPSFLVGGFMFPGRLLPPVARALSHLMPATLIMDSLSASLPEASGSSAPVLVLSCTGLAAFVLALYLFRWDRRYGTRHSPLWAFLALLPPLAGVFWLG